MDAWVDLFCSMALHLPCFYQKGELIYLFVRMPLLANALSLSRLRERGACGWQFHTRGKVSPRLAAEAVLSLHGVRLHASLACGSLSGTGCVLYAEAFGVVDDRRRPSRMCRYRCFIGSGARSYAAHRSPVPKARCVLSRGVGMLLVFGGYGVLLVWHIAC